MAYIIHRNMGNFENQLQNAVFSGNPEKTTIDKLLAKSDIDAIREIIKKPRLTRSEILEILYLLSGAESKLLNYSEWDRYVILKFFTWLRDFVKGAELLYDYKADLEKKEKTCKECEKLFKKFEEFEPECKCTEPQAKKTVTRRTKKLLENAERLMEHNIKFLIDLYLNIGRTSLSVGGTGIMEFLKNKFEYHYGGNIQGIQGVQPPNAKTGLFGFKGK